MVYKGVGFFGHTVKGCTSPLWDYLIHARLEKRQIKLHNILWVAYLNSCFDLYYNFNSMKNVFLFFLIFLFIFFVPLIELFIATTIPNTTKANIGADQCLQIDKADYDAYVDE